MKIEKIGNITFILGDCMDFLEGQEQNAFDLAIADPPYGILKIGQKFVKPSRPNSYKLKPKHKNKKWDKRPSLSYFIELKRSSKDVIIWGGNYFSDLLTPSGCWIFWDKINGDGSHFADGEFAYTTFSSASKKFKCSVNQGNRAGKGRIHPTQKPVKLYKWLLLNYAKKGAKILDTHGGSGSIAIACYQLGFELTIIEKDKDYFNAMLKRFKLETAQKQLF